MEPQPWVAPGQAQAFADFWEVYAANFDALTAEAVRVAQAIPALKAWLGRALSASGAPPTDWRAVLQRAMDGDWRGYEAGLAEQGVSFARMGVGFSEWFQITIAQQARLTELLVGAHAAHPERLSPALAAMQEFFARRTILVRDEFVRAKEVLARSTEQALRASEERYRLVFEACPLPMWIFDSETLAFLAVNDAAIAHYGYSRDAFLKMTLREIRAPEDQDALRDALAERPVDYHPQTLRHRKRDGTLIQVEVRAHMVVFDGRVGRLVVLTDVTKRLADEAARRTAEAAIERLNQERAVEARFRALLESAPDAMVILDALGQIALVNSATERLFGHPRARLIGQPGGVLWPPRLRAKADALALAAVGPGPAVALELAGLREDGSELPIEVTVSPLKTEGGALTSIAIRDISERKRVEQALRLANQELEAFSYSVAHDLRAPLRGMSGFAQVLIEDFHESLGPQAQDSLREIQTNAARMGTLIDALLSLSRVTRSEIDAVATDLSALARSVVAELQRTDPRPAAEIHVQDQLVAILDPRLARLLMENLIGNAWKFTAGTAKPRIEVGLVAGSGGAAFFVRDNGAGFDMAHASKLFAPFQRLHTVSEFAGTGIGLATVQRIVHRHGGRVWAEGQVGAGATFHFEVAHVPPPSPAD